MGDGTGIYFTPDCGQTWECITDHIPLRSERSSAGGYAIPVDPDDFNHVFAFMNNASVYESKDCGQSWRKIQGATHKGFKRGECFRDARGNLKFIGCTRPGNVFLSQIWISEDTCKTWTAVELPDSIKETSPANGARGAWFQSIEFDPSNRDLVYLPSSRSLYYFDDGATSRIENGKRVYNIKRKHFTVYAPDGTTKRYPPVGKWGNDIENNDAIFPCPASAVGNLVVNPNNPRQMWFATGAPVTMQTAVYRTDDGGASWLTLNDTEFGYGSGLAYGDEMPMTWLGGFGASFGQGNDTTTTLHGTTFITARSNDGGRTFVRPIGWHTSLKVDYGEHNGASLGLLPIAASRHHADNHFIRSHKTGRVYRGCDAGLLMCDPEKNGGAWMYVGTEGMGNMLFYHISTNEFGDQVIAGNTQDVDGQTYRYGRWGRWRGYEGSEGFINPYTSTVYFPNMGQQGWDPNHMDFGSWRKAQTRADVVNGNWYVSRTYMGGRSLMRVEDIGQTTVSLIPNIGEDIGVVGKYALSRDKGRCTVYVITGSNKFKVSHDGGDTFQQLYLDNGVIMQYSGSSVAADPNDDNHFFFGQGGRVYDCYTVNDGDRVTATELGTGLPAGLGITELLLHEGSGDLYYFSAGTAGFYILEYDKVNKRYADTWRFWTKGYNIGKCNHAEINYTTQEMVISDYGRGVWIADLEHPADRFFEDGFALKEFSYLDGRRTIGIDTEWTIPLYYYFKWTVKGKDDATATEVTDCPYQYLRKKLNPGDEVQLTLTLRESPDVHTTSAVFVIPENVPDRPNVENDGQPADQNPEGTPAGEGSDNPETDPDEVYTYDNPVQKIPGYALYSNGKGRVDLGYQDYFFNDFTIDMWIKPMGNGTILANRGRDGDPKGFDLKLDNGCLKFHYYPRNFRQYAHDHRLELQQTTTLKDVQEGSINSRVGIEFGQWTHIAVTQTRGTADENGKIYMYINGDLVGEGDRIMPDATLNNSCILSLFGDAIELNTIETSVDELKIWNHALTQEEVRREMYSTNCTDDDGLVAYFPFNAGTLDQDRETFTRKGIRSRVKAEVQYQPMQVPTCARRFSYGQFSSTNPILQTTDSKNVNRNVLGVYNTASSTEGESGQAAVSLEPADLTGNFGVYLYDASQWQNEEDNLDTDYFQYHKIGYLIHAFDSQPTTDELVFDLYPVEGEFNKDGKINNDNFRVYTSPLNGEKQVWSTTGKAMYIPEKKCIRISGISMADLEDQKILIVTPKPSIELKVVGMGDDGIISIYDMAQNRFDLKASLLSGVAEPKDVYEIEADGIVLPSGIFFTDGQGNGELRLDLNKLGDFNSTQRSTLRSKDKIVQVEQTDANGNVVTDANGNTVYVEKKTAPMVPLTIDVRNRIAPRSIGRALRMMNGHADIGTKANFKSLVDNHELTMMGWVRVDSTTVKDSGGFNLITLQTPSGVTGLRFNRSFIEYAQNGKVAWRPTNANLIFRPEDLGNWNHIAIVKTPDKLRLYLNGSYVEANYANRPITDAGVGDLHLGKNSALSQTNNNDFFSGAFDQVGVWNRALSHEEVIKYMYSAVPMNDEGLLSYLNMDYTDENDIPRDIYSMAEIRTYPTPTRENAISYGEDTPLPFDSRQTVESTDESSPISLTYTGGPAVTPKAWISTFRGKPFCYLNHEYQNYTAFNNDFYGITFETRRLGAEPNEAITLTYRNKLITQDEHLAVAMRRTGTQEHLSGFIAASGVTDGQATFEIPGSYLYEPSEVMFFVDNTQGGSEGGSTYKPANLHMSIGQAMASRFTDMNGVPTVMLGENETSIPVTVDILSLARNATGNEAPVKIVIDKHHQDVTQDMVTPTQETIDFNKPENHFNLNINFDNINKYGINEITMNLEGANADPLKLAFYLEPYVHLSLLDGDHRQIMVPDDDDPYDDEPKVDEGDGTDPNPDIKTQNSPRKAKDGEDPAQDDTNTLRIRKSVANLHIKAELTRGYLKEDEEVKLDIITDMSNSLSMGNGDLLSNDPVTMENLEHVANSESGVHDGWNLVGNPYLTDINLTKEQNVDYDPEAVTKFIYQCNPVTGNFDVYDMTSYEENHKVHPFQSFFVQTMRDKAEFTVTPVAKEAAPTKKTAAYTVEQKRELVIGLFKDGPDGNPVQMDRVILRIEADASSGFVKNEDAPKLVSMTGTSPEIFALLRQATQQSVNDEETDLSAQTVDAAVSVTKELKSALGIRYPQSGEQLKLGIISTSGLEQYDITIKDNVSGREWKPKEDSDTYMIFSTGSPAQNGKFRAATREPERFSVNLTDIPTGAEAPRTGAYKIFVDNGLCTVSGLQGSATVSVYTPTGQNVMTTQTPESEISFTLEDGYYIVVIRENGKEFTSKIMI